MIAGTSDYEIPPWISRMFRGKPPPEASPTDEETRQSSFAWEPELLAYLTEATPVTRVPVARRKRKPRVYTRLQAERDLVTRLAFGETIACQDDLAARYGVDKSTISKWLARWERKRLIPRRQRVGRYKTLAKV
jgi:hypothetical protein